ncbi:MAG: Fe(3+) ABC transporter substrate-binding protein, partial [Curvibacter sp.]
MFGVCSPALHAQDKVLNVYSARHYPGDVQLYSAFTQATGIQIKRVDAD